MSFHPRDRHRRRDCDREGKFLPSEAPASALPASQGDREGQEGSEQHKGFKSLRFQGGLIRSGVSLVKGGVPGLCRRVALSSNPCPAPCKQCDPDMDFYFMMLQASVYSVARKG